MTANITIVIVTFKSEKKIERCLDSIDSDIRTIIIENSNSKNFKNKIENKYKNVECLLPGTNLGYSKANNLGLSKVKTKYALILNPDTVLEKNAINNFFNLEKKLSEFAIIGPNQDEKIDQNTSGDPYEVNKIKGYAMFLNMTKFLRIGFFDENFFLYLEEIDLCKRIKKIDEKIFIDPKIQVMHDGGKSVDSELDEQVELSRNWHWMWSLFYFNKKHYNFVFALILIMPKLFSSIIKTILYFLFFNSKKRNIYFMRLSGLINSIIGKPSWHRISLS